MILIEKAFGLKSSSMVEFLGRLNMDRVKDRLLSITLLDFHSKFCFLSKSLPEGGSCTNMGAFTRRRSGR